MKASVTKGGSNFFNALLYSTESITALLFAVVSLSLIARHFGPETLARYNVAQSVSTMFVVFSTLGLEQFVVRELARNTRDAEYVTSILIGMFAGWLIYVGLIIAYYLFFQNFDRDLFLIASVSIATLFIKVIFIKSYLQAQNKPKPIAIGSLVSRSISVTYLLVGTQLNFTFEIMMLYLPLQAFVLFLVMLLSRPDFLRLIKLRHFRFGRLTKSTREAFPVFLSTVLYFFYNQSDVLIMSHLLDANSVGMYSASIKLIPQAAFIGYVLVATFYKEMDKKLLGNQNAFNSYVRSLLSIQFGVAILLSFGVYLTSDLLINVLYGSRYIESGRVLKIACWAWVFILPAALYSRMLIMLGYAKYELIKMLIVAPMIVILNYVAILRIGIIGSAYVFVLSYFLVDFFVYFLFDDTRHFGVLGMKAVADIIIRPRKTIKNSIGLLKAKA